jgi:hypothetical protein
MALCGERFDNALCLLKDLKSGKFRSKREFDYNEMLENERLKEEEFERKKLAQIKLQKKLQQ